MKKEIKLTEKEMRAFKVIVKNGLGAMGGKCVNDLIDDNYSWFDRQDLSDELGINKNEAAGIISALDEKQLIFKDRDCWCLSDFGLEFALYLEKENQL